MNEQEAISIIKTAIAQVEWEYPMDYAAAFDVAIKALEKTKDPDRAKVVRCRDCVYWEPNNAEGGDASGRCRNSYRTCDGQQTDMTWFCADGERKEKR